MAEKVEVIDIDITTIKDLREEIKRLRGELEGAAIGSEDFNNTLEQLTKTQTALKNATKTSNKEMEAAEGSYDALTRKMSELKKQWRATADEIERGKLGQEIAEINTQLKDMDASLGNFQRNVGNYGSAFEGVTLKVDGNTASFERNISMTRTALDSFKLIEGGMHALGIESEGVEKVLGAVQGAMIFTEGLRSVKETADGFKTLGVATKVAEASQSTLGVTMNATTVATTGATIATNTFKKALIATGIGAIVVALGALIANFDKLLPLIKNNASEADKAKESFDDWTESIENTSRIGKNELERLAARGADSLTLLREELKLTQDEFDNLDDKLIQTRLKLDDAKWWQFGLKKALKSQIEEIEEMQEKATEKVIELNDKVTTQRIKNQEDLKKKALELIDSLSEYEMTEDEKKIKRANEQYREEYDIIKKAYDQKLISAEAYNKAIDTLNLRYADQAAEASRILDTLIDPLPKIKPIVTEATTSIVTGIERIVEDKKLIEDVPAFLDSLTYSFDALAYSVSELSALSMGDLSNEWSETFARVGDTLQTVKFTMEDIEKIKEEGGETWTAYGQIASSAFGVASSAMMALADQQDEQQEEGFEKQKKFQIAAATMSMLQGIISAVTSAFNPANAWMTIYGQAALAASTSAMIATMGGIQIANIKKQTFEGGSGSNNTSSLSMPSVQTPSMTALSALQSPVNTVTNVQGASVESNVKDTRVWVSETDITNVQNRVNVTESEATY